MSKERPRPWHNPTPLVGFEPEWAGQFDTFDDWVNHASRALTGEVDSNQWPLPAICVDAKGRRCNNGKDFMLARDEAAFPVRYFWTGRVEAPRKLEITYLVAGPEGVIKRGFATSAEAQTFADAQNVKLEYKCPLCGSVGDYWRRCRRSDCADGRSGV